MPNSGNLPTTTAEDDTGPQTIRDEQHHNSRSYLELISPREPASGYGCFVVADPDTMRPIPKPRKRR
jgi:hypothetical protein